MPVRNLAFTIPSLVMIIEHLSRNVSIYDNYIESIVASNIKRDNDTISLFTANNRGKLSWKTSCTSEHGTSPFWN